MREKAPDILFLMEMKQTVDEMSNIQVDLHYDSMLAIPCVRQANGLAMLWKARVDLHVQTCSPNHIDAHIMNGSLSPWKLTGFYWRPKEHRKHESWEYLRHLHSRDSLPWLCLGDYNEILSSDEKQGRVPRSLRRMKEFWSALLHCRLIDLGFNGNIFTWRNGRPSIEFVQERLVRACANIEWRDLFPHSKVHHLQAAYSNPDPILLTTEGDPRIVRPSKKPHRLKEHWASHPACANIIHEVWNGWNPMGSPMHKLFEKIKIKNAVGHWWSGVEL